MQAAVEESNVETQLVILADKNIRPCDEYRSCRTTKECHIKNDLVSIFDKMIRADVIILAYLLLAYMEELHLCKNYGHSFNRYRKKVPLLIPLLNADKKFIEILVSILTPVTLLLVLIMV